MKLKRLLPVFGLVAMLGLGVGVGLVSTQKPVEKAEATSRTIYFKLTGTHWQNWGSGDADALKAYFWNSSDGNNDNSVWGTGTSGTNVTVGTSDAEKYVKFTIDHDTWDKVIFISCGDWNDSHQQNRTVDFSIPTDGNDLMIINTTNGNTAQDGGWSKMYAPAGSTIYFVDGYSWHSTSGHGPMAHVWGETGTTWPGAAMSEVANIGLKAGVGDDWEEKAWYSTIRIYSYTTTAAARYVIFNDNDNGSKTGNLLLTDGAVYGWKVNEKYYPVVSLLVKIKQSLKTQTNNSNDGKTYTESVCGITLEDATAIVSKYSTIHGSSDPDVVSSVEGSSLYTYVPNNLSSKTDVTLDKIIEQLGVQYPALSLSRNPGAVVASMSDDNSTIIIVASAAAVAVIAVGGYFFIRKRKEY